MKDLLRAAARVQAYCSKARWRFCLIGGIPVQHWGEPRFTRDIDLTVLTGFGGEQKYITALLGQYRPRVEDAEQLAREARVLLLEGPGGIDLDIALGALPFEELAVERARDVQMMPGIKLRICSPEDLIIFKVFAGRDLDWHDVKTTILRQGEKSLDWSYIRRQLRPLLDAKGELQSLDQLRRLRRELRGKPRGRQPQKRRRR
jgi:hypothetical protein